MSLHQRRTHPVFQPDCYACRISTVALSTSTDCRETEARERLLRKDLDAYRRLRQDGVQPPNVTGAADLERTATTRMQVEEPRMASVVEAYQ